MALPLGTAKLHAVPRGLAQNTVFNINSVASTPPQSLLAQVSPPKPLDSTNKSNDKTSIPSANVVLDGEVLFTIKSTLGEVSPKERARTINSKLLRIAQDDAIAINSIRVVEIKNLKDWRLIQAGDILITVLTPDDVKGLNQSLPQVAEESVKKIQIAVQNYREARTQENLVKGIIQAIIVTMFVSVLLYVINRFLPITLNDFTRKIEQYFQQIDRQIQIFFFLPSRQLARLISITLKIVRLFLIVFIFYLYIPFLLSSFPATKGIGIQLLSYFWKAVNFIGNGVVDYLPNLFIIALILVIAYYSIRFARIFFKAIQTKAIAIPGFYAEWAIPTLNITIFFIVGLSAVLIFPYLPASSSQSFQGVSIFIGALFTFGSTSIIGNVVSGIVLIYTRAFQLGDIIQVNGQRGKVIKKGMLTTQILTPDNEVITIPNGSLLVTDITNFSAAIRDRQQPLLLKTTVTLGYDLPWRKVHETLISAAKATEGILTDPEPFVLQTSLDDFYVSYTLKAFTNQPEMMPLIYSSLHQNIQDKCNEVDIEIMSPHYSTLRDGNQSTIPSNYLADDYEAPGFRVDARITEK
jgi:small-conductance mechanosensitive channel